MGENAGSPLGGFKTAPCASRALKKACQSAVVNVEDTAMRASLLWISGRCPRSWRALREYTAKRGWTVVEECKEVGSGAAARAMRQRLIESSRRRAIDVVLVWRLDRSKTDAECDQFFQRRQ